MGKHEASRRGDSSAEMEGSGERWKAFEAVRRGEPGRAIAIARSIRHPWYRCQSLGIVAKEIPDPTLRLALVDEAFTAADQLIEPNRIVTAASWPIEVLAMHGPSQRLRSEVDRLLAVAATEPHGLRRADAQSFLLHRAWPDEPARTRALDAFLKTCASAHGWRRDRLLSAVAPRLATVDRGRAAEVAAMIEGPRAQRRTHRDIEAALAAATP